MVPVDRKTARRTWRNPAFPWTDRVRGIATAFGALIGLSALARFVLREVPPGWVRQLSLSVLLFFAVAGSVVIVYLLLIPPDAWNGEPPDNPARGSEF